MVGKDISDNLDARREAQTRVREAQLIFTTCTGAGLGLLRFEKFGFVLIAKASQLTNPEALIPLTKRCKRAVLVGDHAQPHVTVQKHAVITGFNISLFERLYNTPNGTRPAKVMLVTQYRAHPDICAFSSREFYNDKLKSAKTAIKSLLPPSQFPWPKNKRMVFIQCSTPEDLGNASKSNPGQVQLCKTICDLLKAPASPNQSDHSALPANQAEITILTPYKRQKELVKTEIPGCEVYSTDGYVDSYADIVIFLSVRCNSHYDIGALKDIQRLNMAITRAKAGFIVIGDRLTLIGTANGEEKDESKAVWTRLLSSCVELQLPSAN
jgi:superfamily I DNA and/or RNA helicase